MAAGQSALVGGVLLGIIEGVSSVISRTMQETPREQALKQIEMEKQMREYKTKVANGEASAGFWGTLSKLTEGPVVPKSGAELPRTESSFVDEAPVMARA